MTTIVIMPGGFHPFHAGHYALYQSAQKAFPGAEVFVAATNDTSARPFPFAVKEKLAKLAGVEPGHFVQVRSPFRAEEITSKFDPARDRLIFVRSEKDADKPPQAGGIKRDGSAAYLQPLAGQTNIRPFKEHAYMAYLPTVEFGPGMTSATEIRTAWPTLNEKRKTTLVMSLYPRTQGNPKLANTVVKLLDAAIGTEPVAEAADPRFMNFMNTSLGDRTDQPSKKIKTGQDWYDNTPTMNIDSGMVNYRPALDFCNKTLQKLNPSQKIKLSTLGEQGVVSWLAKQAKKQGLIPDQFMEEDIYEVQDFLPEVFHDPAITSWALVLTDGEPLPTPPTKGPFKVIMNQGLPSPTKGYANSDWVDVDTLDNLPAAEEIFKGMVLKNPNYYVGITSADHKFVKFQDPHKQDVAEGQEKNHWYDAGVKDATRGARPNPRTYLPTLKDKQAKHPEEVDFYMNGYKSVPQGVAEGSEEAEKYRAQLLKTAPRVMDFLAKTVKGWRPSEQEMLGAIDTAYTVMKHTGDVKQAGKAMVDELNTLHRMSQGQSGMTENFADGRNPQDKGDAKRHGINTKASVSSLRKTAKSGGRKGQLAHWLANMKAGRAKNEDADSDYIEEKWSAKYKSSINCADPKGFSQKAHCAGRKK
jgi:hypothetical protein